MCKSYYKRVDHLNEKLSQLMGRQNVRIPELVFQRVQDSIKAAKVEADKVDGLVVRAHLKKMRMGKHYELANAIANKLTRNKSVVRIDHVMEENLRKWFLKIQAPFEKHKGGGKRKSFLNYNYCLYQLLTLLPDTRHLTSQLVMLKSKARLKEHDAIWKKICEETGLPYKPFVVSKQ